MKKILFIFCTLFLSFKVHADGKNIISTLSCEGEVVNKYYENNYLYKNEKKAFYEDLEINIMDWKKKSNKKEIGIYAIKILESSHWFQRDGWYWYWDSLDNKKKANLKVSKDNLIISLINNSQTSEEGMKFETTTSRLSLKNGIYAGTARAVKNDLIFESSWRSKCVGVPALLRLLNPGKTKSYLDYWWAVILIIAITFFIFTQSGKRLKQIRRK
jgi:hypothetical protein